VSKRAVCAAREQAERAWAGLRAKFQAARRAKNLFLFPFIQIFADCLNLCNNSCVNPKIMEIFV
jgi:hypothetical protein